jgi:hypothetical protein
MNCPFISPPARTAALLFLHKHGRKHIKSVEDLVSLEEGLLFTTRQRQPLSVGTANFLVFGPINESPSYSQPLLKMVHAYDAGVERELSQAVRKMGVGNGRDVLRVANLWCLSLGPGTCRPVTFSILAI